MMLNNHSLTMITLYMLHMKNSNVVNCGFIPLNMCFILQLYSWGCGPCLGCGSAEFSALRPRIIEDLQTKRIVDIVCGDSHCLALSHGTCTCNLSMIRKRISVFFLNVHIQLKLVILNLNTIFSSHFHSGRNSGFSFIDHVI